MDGSNTLYQVIGWLDKNKDVLNQFYRKTMNVGLVRNDYVFLPIWIGGKKK